MTKYYLLKIAFIKKNVFYYKNLKLDIKFHLLKMTKYYILKIVFILK